MNKSIIFYYNVEIELTDVSGFPIPYLFLFFSAYYENSNAKLLSDL